MKLPTLLVLFRSITPSDEEVRLGIFACDRSLKKQLDSNHVQDNKEDGHSKPIIGTFLASSG